MLSNGSKQGVIYNWSDTKVKTDFCQPSTMPSSLFHRPRKRRIHGLDERPDMSRLLIAGQAYHGRCVQNGVINDASTLMTVTSYIAPTSGATRYFKSPYAPGSG